MTYKYTNSSNKVIGIASDIAMELGHSYIGTEHILYGLAEEGSGIASKVLESQDVRSDKILDKMEEFIGKEDAIDEIIDFTPRTKRVVEVAFVEARKLGYNFIGTEHLLIGILREGDSIAAKILLDLNVNIPKLYNEIIKVINEGESYYSGNDEDSSADIQGMQSRVRKRNTEIYKQEIMEEKEEAITKHQH